MVTRDPVRVADDGYRASWGTQDRNLASRLIGNPSWNFLSGSRARCWDG